MNAVFRQMTFYFRHARVSLIATMVAAAMVLAACGGGSGGSATPAPPIDGGGNGNTDNGGGGTDGGNNGGNNGNNGGNDGGGTVVDVALPKRPANSTNIAWEHVRPQHLWVVNPDNDSVTVIDGATRTRLAEIDVARAPRTIAFSASGEAWVVSRGASAATVIDPVNFNVKRTVPLPAASQPYGIVFSPADGSAWIGLAATGEVIKVDPSSGAVTARIAVGGEPRHLAITGTGDRLLVSRYITAPIPGESTKTPVGTDAAGVAHGGELTVIDPAAAAVLSRITLGLTGGTDNAIRSRGVPNYLGAAAIAPDNGSAWIPSKQDNVQRGEWRDTFAIDFQSAVRAISSKVLLGALPVEDAAQRIDLDNSSIASAAVFEPNGRYVFVALETSREISVIDAVDGRESRRVLAGFPGGLTTATAQNYAPQGVAISADGKQLAVNYTLGRVAGLFDLSVIEEMDFDPFPEPEMVTTVTREKLSAEVLRGKQLFHDAFDLRLARDRYMSCASCHNEGGDDGRVWDLTHFGEGLRNTISLNGRSGASLPLHWSGNFDEVQDFEGQIRDLAGGRGLLDDSLFAQPQYRDPLGSPKAGLSSDLDALAAYVKSLSQQEPSPWRNAGRSLTASAVAGKAAFAARGCASCHSGEQFAGDGSARHDVGTMGESTRPWAGDPTHPTVAALDGIDTPTLRDVWATAPYLHDGSAATVEEAIRRHTTVSEAAELTQLADYVRQIGSEEPAP